MIRILSEDVAVESVVFYRNLIALILFLPHIHQHRLDFFKTTKIGWHFFRSMVGLSAMYAFFYAIATFSLADAMLFVYAAPVFVPLFAFWVLNESIHGRQIWVAMLGLLGIAFVFRPVGNLLGMAPIGLFCTFMSSLAFVVVRKLSFTEPAERVVFYFSLFGTLAAILPLFILPAMGITFAQGEYLSQSEYQFKHWALLGLVGVVTTIAQWFLTRGYSFAPAGRIAPASYLTVVIAGFYGWLIWEEVPSGYSMLGYVIVFAAILMTLSKTGRDKKAQITDPVA